MKTLIITEKPSVAGDFAAALGAIRKKGYYENDDTIIAYCIGHLLELYDPEDYRPEYKTWSLEALPIIPEKFRYKPKPNTTAQLNIMKRLLADQYERIIIATDAGREGELIARTVLAHAKVKDLSRARRFWSSEALTPEVIRKNLENLRPATDYEALYRAGLFRQLADWLTGYNLTRLLSIKMSATFPFGRVQTAVLTFLAHREAEINAFEPQSRYQLTVTAMKEDQRFGAYYIEEDADGLFPNRTKLDDIVSVLSKMPFPATVTDITTEEHSATPPQLYNLTALQQQANKEYGLTAEQTLAAAQALYETHKCLSYPRTPSRALPLSAGSLFSGIVQKITPDYPQYFYHAGPINLGNTRLFNDSRVHDHHALIVLDLPPAGLDKSQTQVYDLVVRSMAAVLAEPNRTATTTLTLSAFDKRFRAQATITKQLGWKAIYQKPTNTSEPSQQEDIPQNTALPPVTKNSTVLLSDPRIIDKPTQAPKPYTEARVLAIMEKNSLGTEATRAPIIQKLIRDQYCRRSQRTIRATGKALHLINAIEGLSTKSLANFASPEQTALWEDKLRTDPLGFFSEIKTFVQTSFRELKEVSIARYRSKALGSCPNCGAAIREGEKNYYCSRYREGCKFHLWKTIAHHRLTAEEIGALTSGKTTQPLKMRNRKGQPFTAALAYNKETLSVDFIYEN